jgi:DNA-binding response OmpR family regulator
VANQILVDKILVAEDEDDIRNLVKKILEKTGYEVILARNGIEAEEKINKELPDLALIDIVMPQRGGFDVSKSIKKNKSTNFIPVVMFSVLSRAIDKKMSHEAGANGHITKPFIPDELVEQIQNHINISKKNRFSRATGLVRDKLLGKNILFEYNSSSPYERHVRDFLIEGDKNGETAVVITHSASAIHNSLQNEVNISIIPFKVPVVLSQIFKQPLDEKYCFVFDSITDLILSAGFQTSYNFVKDTLSRFSNKDISAMFLLNPDSHNTQEVQRIRNLFMNQLKFETSINVVKLG